MALRVWHSCTNKLLKHSRTYAIQRCKSNGPPVVALGVTPAHGVTLGILEDLNKHCFPERTKAPAFCRCFSGTSHATPLPNEQSGGRGYSIGFETNKAVDSEDEEFVPNNVEIPRTPLAQAIQDAQGDGILKDSSSRARSLVGGEIPASDRAIDPLRVYVGSLPFASTSHQIKEGPGKHRGYGFVTFYESDSAKAAISKANGEKLLGREITVSASLKRLELDPALDEQLKEKRKAERVPRCKLFVGKLHEDTTVETLESRFEQYGAIVAAKIACEVGTGKSRGFGFITFSEEAHAMKAALDLDGSILDGSVITVNLAKYPNAV